MHEIEEKFFPLNDSQWRNKSYSMLMASTRSSMREIPRNYGGGLGASYLAVSLLFQLPLMEIIFIMGLIILVLGEDII